MDWYSNIYLYGNTYVHLLVQQNIVNLYEESLGTSINLKKGQDKLKFV